MTPRPTSDPARRGQDRGSDASLAGTALRRFSERPEGTGGRGEWTARAGERGDAGHHRIVGAVFDLEHLLAHLWVSRQGSVRKTRMSRFVEHVDHSCRRMDTQRSDPDAQPRDGPLDHAVIGGGNRDAGAHLHLPRHDRIGALDESRPTGPDHDLATLMVITRRPRYSSRTDLEVGVAPRSQSGGCGRLERGDGNTIHTQRYAAS